MTRTIPLAATLLFALILGAVGLRPDAETHASFEISELELLVRQPDGDVVAAHFLVRASDEHEALSAALATIGDLYPGATVYEMPVEHGPAGHGNDGTRSQDAEGVRAQWLPWGWTWDDDELPVPVHYNPAGAVRGFTPEDVIAALEIWSSVETSSFGFEYIGETNLPASMNVDGADGFNVIAWQDLGCGAGCVLGLTTKNFRTHEVDISLNSHADARLGDGENGTFDVLTVLLHELGHMAGLEHSCPAFGPCSDAEREAVMFYSYSGVRHELGEDDISGISALYPADEQDDGIRGDGIISAWPLPAPEQPALTIQISPGWNLTMLPAARPTDLVLALTCVEAIYEYDPVEGWSHWVRGLYPILQTLDRIDPATPYWVLASDGCGAYFN